MREVSSDLQGRDGRVEGSTCELKTASDYCDPTIVSLFSAMVEVGEGELHSFEQLLSGEGHSVRIKELSELLLKGLTNMEEANDQRAHYAKLKH